MNVDLFIRAARAGNYNLLRSIGGTLSAADWDEFFAKAVYLDDLPDATWQYFERLWIGRGISIRNHVGNDAHLVAALRRLTRPYRGPGLPVWRGQAPKGGNEVGTFGLSWATRYATAREFGLGHEWNRRGGLVILHAHAPPEAIVTIPRSGAGPAGDAILAEIVIDVDALPSPPVIAEVIDRPMTDDELAFSRGAVGT